MNFFELKADYDGYAAMGYVDEDVDAWWSAEQFIGNADANQYAVVGATVHAEDRELVRPDFTKFNQAPIPVFSARARDALRDLLEPNGQFVGIDFDEPLEYWAFNTTTVVDVLDEAASDIKRFSSSGGIMRINAYVLKAEVSDLPPIFKIPQTQRSGVYVSDEFVARVSVAGLTGFKFVQLA